MYRLSNLWKQEPVAIAEAAKSLFLVVILLGVIHLEPEQLAAIIMAISLVLGLLIRQSVDSPQTAAEKDAVIKAQDSIIEMTGPGLV